MFSSHCHNRFQRGARLAGHLLTATVQRLPYARSARKAIGYIGCHRSDNLGDMAMHQIAVRLLGKDRLIDFHAARHEALLGTVCLTGHTVFAHAVLGGGTLINPYFLPPVLALWKSEVPFWTFGTGVGSVGFEQDLSVDLNGWREPLNQALGLGVRGPLSRARLHEIGCVQAEVVGDPALCWATSRVREPSGSVPTILVNLAGRGTGSAEEEQDRVMGKIVMVLQHLRQQGCRIIPVAMTAQDRFALRSLLERLGMGGTRIEQPATPHEFLDVAAQCRMALVMRLHAAVFSCCAGVLPVVLGYRDKCLDFMAAMGLSKWHLDLKKMNAENLEGLCQEALERPELGRSAWQMALHFKAVFERYVDRMLVLSKAVAI